MNLSFSKRSPEEQLAKAKQVLHDLEVDALNEDCADSCAEEVNKCIDYIHRQGLCGCNTKDVNICRKSMRSKCPALGIMQDIADSAKHDGIDRKRYTVKSSRRHNGAFSSGFSRDFDISRLVVLLEDGGDEKDFIDAASEALQFLENVIGT